MLSPSNLWVMLHVRNNQPGRAQGPECCQASICLWVYIPSVSHTPDSSSSAVCTCQLCRLPSTVPPSNFQLPQSQIYMSTTKRGVALWQPQIKSLKCYSQKRWVLMSRSWSSAAPNKQSDHSFVWWAHTQAVRTKGKQASGSTEAEWMNPTK